MYILYTYRDAEPRDYSNLEDPISERWFSLSSGFRIYLAVI